MAISLKRTQRAFSKIGYVGNFLNADVKPGNIYQMDDKVFLFLANIADLVPGLDLSDKISTGAKSNLKYDSESNVQLTFGANAALKLGKGEVLLEFKRSNTALVSLAEANIQQLKLELLSEQIQSVWTKKKYRRNGRHVLVSDVVNAKSGTVIFTQEKGNKVVLKHTGDQSISSVARLATGQFEYVANTKGTLEVISTEPMTPMFKAVYPTQSGLFEVLG